MGERHTTNTQFRELDESSAEDWHYIMQSMVPFANALPDRVLAHLQLLKGDYGGFPVDRMQHSLQTATRAHRDGRDEEYVVMALLHDIGDMLCTYNHPDIAAAILKPFLSEENLWIVQQHGIFQGLYYFHHIGLDRDMRERYRSHPFFAAAADFAQKYDQTSFDPEYDTAPLAFFEPMVQRVMARPRSALIM